MRCFELIQDTLGIKKGQTFLQTFDGMYVNATNTIKLNSVVVEKNEEYFKEVDPPQFWKPEQPGEAFWTVTPDGGTVEFPWEESRWERLWQFGNMFRDKEHADEVAQAFSAILPTYQKKFTEYIKKNPKPPKLLTSQVTVAPAVPTAPPPGVGAPPAILPPAAPPPAMPPNRNYIHDPRFSPGGVGNLFTTPGNERGR